MADIISSDIYNIAETTNILQKRFMNGVDSDTLMLSIFGYTNENFSNNLQNAIIGTAEWANEYLPITAKFNKTILTNAITYGIKNINAIPATIDVMIGFIEKELKDKMVNNSFTLDKNCKFHIGEYEYHLDYDLIINADTIPNQGVVYTVRYNLTNDNPLSDIDSPYLDVQPIRMIKNNDTFIAITCTLRQISSEKAYAKIISNNILENKTVDFNFSSQMAAFKVSIDNPDKSRDVIEAIYEGMPDSGKRYCYYNYIDEDTIRIKFDTDSYNPNLNSIVEIDITTTRGSDGNFPSATDSINTLQSDIIDYGNMSVLITPITSSHDGQDRKSMEELKKIIPREILARGTIITNKDLENYFNKIDADNRLLFYKKVDNQQERLYYGYLLAKDESDNVIPTNTLDLLVSESEFSAIDDNRYILYPGSTIEYEGSNFAYVRKDAKEGKNKFIYSSPFIMVINKKPLSVSYYLNMMDNTYNFKFDYINAKSFLQYVAVNINCKKVFLEGDSYKLTTRLTQNINIDKELVTVDENGNILSCNIKPVIVFKIDSNNSYYLEGTVKSFDKTTYSYDVEFILESDSVLNSDNNIKIKNVYAAGSRDKVNMYLSDKVNVSLYVYTKFDKSYGKEDNNMIPGIDDYTLCNIYSTVTKLQLFYNYSNIMRSTVSIAGNKTDKEGYTFKVNSVPVFRKSYLDDSDRCMNCIDYIQYRKAYIDLALKTLEDSFTVDLKFVNTYGPSKAFTIGYDGKTLDKVNLTLNFRVKLLVGIDTSVINNIKNSIKVYIENINTINPSMHMYNLTTSIKDEYKSEIEFIEFVGINDYNALLSYLKNNNIGSNHEDISDVPEFLCVNLLNGNTPDINIDIV